MKAMLNKKTLMLISLLVFLILLAGCLPSKNQAPIITSTPSTLAEVDELYTYEVEATDPDGDILTYSLDVKPSDMAINPATGLIEWTPTAEGDYDVVVKVSDGTLDITQSFTIVVSEAEEPGYTPPSPAPPKTYTITASAGSGGSISPSGGVTVNEGSDKSFTITPDANYHIADVLVDGVSKGAVASYTFNNVTKNHTIKATFAIDTYTITATAGDDGIINPSGTVGVNHGENQSFTITPDSVFYGIEDILVDEESVGTEDSYIFTNVTEDHTISATFKFLGPVYNQDQDKHYDTIQVAIDNANANNPGDTILVMAGTYNEAVSIDKQLTLLGAQYDVDPTVEGARIDESAESIIDAGGLSVVVTITADSVSVNGFTVTNGKIGIDLDGAPVYECAISNNKIVENTKEGIWLSESSNGVFENNVISENGNIGIFFGTDQSRLNDGNIIRNNLIEWNRHDGEMGQISIQQYSDDNIIEDNTINGDGKYGIMVGGSNKNTILRRNIINRGESGPGFTFAIGLTTLNINTLLEDNIIHNNEVGVSVVYVETTFIKVNNIQWNEEGIRIKYGSKDTIIEENDILNNDVGINILYAEGPPIDPHLAASTTHINQNNIVDNTDHGVLNEISTPVDATLNWWGNTNGPSHGVVIYGDKVSDNVEYIPWSETQY